MLGKIRQAGGVELEAKVGNDNGEEQLKKIPGVRDVVTDGEDDWKKFSLRVESGADVREEVFRLAVERHWAVRELTQRRGTLEDVFVELTHPEDLKWSEGNANANTERRTPNERGRRFVLVISIFKLAARA